MNATNQLNITIASPHLSETGSSRFCSQLRLVFSLAGLQIRHCSNQLGVLKRSGGICFDNNNTNRITIKLTTTITNSMHTKSSLWQKEPKILTEQQ